MSQQELNDLLAETERVLKEYREECRQFSEAVSSLERTIAAALACCANAA